MHRLEEVAAECEAQIGAIMDDALDHARAVEADPDASDGDATGDQWPRLSRLADRLTRARSAIDRLYERALPSPGEIRAKVEAAERMIARAEERLAAETAAHQDKLRKYEARAAADLAAGRHGANGRPPVPVERKTAVVRQQDRLARATASLEQARNPRSVPSPKTRACSTDPDSRLVPGKQGGFLQGYNVQIASARRQLLLAIEVHDNPSDMNALVPVVTKARLNQQLAGLPGEVGLWLADSGYACTASFETLADLPLLVSVTSEADLAGFPAKRDRPRACHQEMAQRLATPAGQTGYRQRGALVEPGFAQPFQRFGRCLHYRGRHAVDTEVKLLGTVHNLNKLISHKAPRTPLTSIIRKLCDSLGIFTRRFRNPRRTRAGVRCSGFSGFSQGRRRSEASGRARRSWVWAAIVIQVQRSAVAGSRSRGAVQPRVCFRSLKVCSMSNLRRKLIQQRSTSWSVASIRDHHSHTGFASPPDGR